ncbi:Translation elongation factor 4 [Gracilaria domingensis]|nr:Translation elongation factor 4 [Gracilaria domingensis]
MSWCDHKVTLIDCPGHHDFSRQVSQSARAVEGALLVVDATKGVQAQTLSSVELALEAGLELLPVINKIDLPTADVDNARNQIENLVGIDASQAILTSAKQGIGIEELLDAVIERLPAPQGSLERPLQALVFDSYYDSYRGVVLFIRVVNGVVRKGDRISPCSLRDSKELGNKPMEYIVETIGFLEPDEVPSDKLEPGDIGYLTASIKRVGDIPLGDTLTHCGTAAAEAALPGYEPTRPVVFCGLFPSDSCDIHSLRVALQKLQLQDGSIVFEPDTSAAMGTGFRCGFLGLLHMSVTQERLETEFGLDLIASTPSVSYSIQPQGSEEWKLISNPSAIPSGHVKIMEPYAKVEIICSHDHIGPLMDLAQSRRGELRDQRYVGLDRVKLVYSVPLAELVTDFHDVLKSRSAGFASMNYEMEGMKPNKLKRMDIHVAGQPVDGLSSVVHEEKAYSQGRWMVEKLKDVIPRQMFKVNIQAVVGGKILASQHINPYRKVYSILADVTAKCYGGDASRKKKL